jgi:hypothetical protein
MRSINHAVPQYTISSIFPLCPSPLDLNTFLSTLFFNILNLYGRPTSRVDLHAVTSLVPGNPHAPWCRSLFIPRCTCADTQSKIEEAVSVCFSHSTATYKLCDMEGTLTVLYTVFRFNFALCLHNAAEVLRDKWKTKVMTQS